MKVVTLAFASAVYLLVLSACEDIVENAAKNSCEPVPENAAYCAERLFDDGLTRTVTFSDPSLSSCCVLERFNMQSERLDYRIRTCTSDSKITLDCAQYNGAKPPLGHFQIGTHATWVDPDWPGQSVLVRSWPDRNEAQE